MSDQETQTLEQPGPEPVPQGQVESEGGEGETQQIQQPVVQVSPETEREAREMGWRPKEEWRGDPETWKPADEFVRRGKEVLPIVQSRLRKAEAKAQEWEEKYQADIAGLRAEFADRLARNERMSQIALQRQRDHIWHQFEAQKDRAAAEGDHDRYRALKEEQYRAVQQFAPPEVEEEPQPKEPKPNGAAKPQLPRSVVVAMEDWEGRNKTWFGQDTVMTAAAHIIDQQLRKELPGVQPEEHFEELDRRMRQEFPHKFGKTQQAQQPQQQQKPAHAPPVEGGGRQPGGGQRAKGWSDIPPEDRKVADGQVRYFLPKGVDPEEASEADLKKARAEYAAEYWRQF